MEVGSKKKADAMQTVGTQGDTAYGVRVCVPGASPSENTPERIKIYKLMYMY